MCSKLTRQVNRASKTGIEVRRRRSRRKRSMKSSVWMVRLVVVFFFIGNGLAQDATITTYAGPALPVSGTAAITQGIEPTAVISDGAGGFYVAVTSHNRVYRVSASGVLTVIAGSNAYGFAGDAGPATAAKLAFPIGIVRDGAGNLYIADANNHRVRRVSVDGIISTVAGSALAGFSGDGGPAIAARLNQPIGVAVDGAGNLYIA